MASTTTMNAWTEKLVRTLIPENTGFLRAKKHNETFSRNLRHHNYGRTNQFEVQERLIGLQEKFQILNRDDLSDEVRGRVLELNAHFERWIPDVLDLLMQLSHDAVNKSHDGDFSGLAVRASTPPPLKWAEVEADDPIDRRDRIWSEPDFSDLSSEEDQVFPSSSATSPESVKPGKRAEHIPTRTRTEDSTPNRRLADEFRKTIFWAQQADQVTVTEVQAIREVLFMCQDLPTSLFVRTSSGLQPSNKYALASAGQESLRSLLSSAVQCVQSTASIRQWLSRPQTLKCMAVLQDEMRKVLDTFDIMLARLHEAVLNAIQSGGTVSLLKVIKTVETKSATLAMLERILHDGHGGDAVKHLEVLFDNICRTELCDRESYKMLVGVFNAVFNAYAFPINAWIGTGIIVKNEPCFFIQRVDEELRLADLWHKWYICTSSGSARCPNFLRELSETIFAAGKTAAFLRELGTEDHWLESNSTNSFPSLSNAIETACRVNSVSLSSFSAILVAYMKESIGFQLEASTNRLQIYLQQNCGLNRTLDAFEYLYLARNGVIIDAIETKLFDRLDRGVRNWHDRFLTFDLLEEAYENVDAIDPQRVVVHAGSVSSSETSSLRQSVKIMGDLAVEYMLPWPISNIIAPDSLAAYRRIALLLSQIRRAKYQLERVCYRHSPKPLVFQDSRLYRASQGLHFELLFFVNTLYDHLICCIIRPNTEKMREAMSGTLDEMIQVHSRYVKRLESACLLSKNLTVLKDTTISILDLCVRFAITHSNEKQVRDLSGAFKKNVKFLLAGLRGVASAGGEAAEGLQLLADRIDGLRFSESFR